jgi:hypothetical protein
MKTSELQTKKYYNIGSWAELQYNPDQKLELVKVSEKSETSEKLEPGNTKRGSITVPLTSSCLTGLD